jgi:hypothetical protein
MDLSFFQKIDETIKVNEPTFISLVQEQKIEPGDDMVDLFKKIFHFLITFEMGMKEMEKIKIPHPFQSRDGISLLKDEDEL